MISLVSLNVERSKHLDVVIPFLKERQPDVVCLQELCEADIPVYTELFGMPPFFNRGTKQFAESEAKVEGIGIFSRFPFIRTHVEYYCGDGTTVPESVSRDPNTFNKSNRFVATCDVEKDGEIFRIATTHFTWTPKGEPSERQRTDLEAMFLILEGYQQLVLAGDFNAPRRGEIFTKITDHYFDNIPPYYKTSLDINIHRSGVERRHELFDKMVDGLFTTADYRASDVQLVFGVSDHAAVVGNISKRAVS